MVTETQHTSINDRPATQANVLTIHNLYKSFGKNHVLIDFNLELSKGESVVVLGKSGSGKSVLIKCVIGLLKPDSGTIELLGESIPEIREQELDQIRARVWLLVSKQCTL